MSSSLILIQNYTTLRTTSWPYTDLASNEMYILVYRNILRILFRGLLPFIALVIANVRLLWIVRCLKKMLPYSEQIAKLK